MSEKYVNRVKHNGAMRGLLGSVSSALWMVKRHADDSSKDQYKHFPRHIAEIKRQTKIAEECWKEYEAMRRAKP